MVDWRLLVKKKRKKEERRKRKQKWKKTLAGLLDGAKRNQVAFRPSINSFLSFYFLFYFFFYITTITYEENNYVTRGEGRRRSYLKPNLFSNSSNFSIRVVINLSSRRKTSGSSTFLPFPFLLFETTERYVTWQIRMKKEGEKRIALKHAINGANSIIRDDELASS